ncbi:hypothetical protein, partial [Escherichia coli]|uniref:hypothetical protein n=1 Tax=Escherichia coli TaxID=562 RepID=UPI0013876320
LEELSSVEIGDAEELREGLRWVFEKSKGKISSVAISLNPSETIIVPDKEVVNNAIIKLKSNHLLTDGEKNHLMSFTIREFLNLIKDSNVVFQ